MVDFAFSQTIRETDPTSRMGQVTVNHLPSAIQKCFADLPGLHRQNWPHRASDRIASLVTRMTIAFPPSQDSLDCWIHRMTFWIGDSPFPTPWDRDRQQAEIDDVEMTMATVARSMVLHGVMEILTVEQFMRGECQVTHYYATGTTVRWQQIFFNQ